MSERFKRQSDIIKPEQLNVPIHVIGAGGIGSWSALLLAKMGCTDITVYDDDLVEEHNIASQFFTIDDLGKLKTAALIENVYQQTGTTIFSNMAAGDNLIKNGLVIIAVDSMKRRAELAQIYKELLITIIDARMGGLQLEIYLTAAKDYHRTIVDPDLVTPDACTARSISFNCAVIGGLVANYVRLLAIDVLELPQAIIFGFNEVQLLKKAI